ncbi:hypothetical protein HK098_007016 [Nowakowskiella sp. JEL0407]|nr:hypothetical protein HK098_007016 [Nowakowskiella sp. JEL0407]
MTDIISSFPINFQENDFTTSMLDVSNGTPSLLSTSAASDSSTLTRSLGEDLSLSPEDALSLLQESFLTTLLIDVQWHTATSYKPMISGARAILEFVELRSDFEDRLLESKTTSLKLSEKVTPFDSEKLTLDNIDVSNISISEPTCNVESEDLILEAMYDHNALGKIDDVYFSRRSKCTVLLYDEVGSQASFSAQLAQVIAAEGVSLSVYYIKGGLRQIQSKYPPLINYYDGTISEDQLLVEVPTLIGGETQNVPDSSKFTSMPIMRSRQQRLVDAVWYGLNRDTPSEIIKGLYLGSCYTATKKATKKYGITHILRFGHGFENKCIPHRVIQHSDSIKFDEINSPTESEETYTYHDFPIDDTPNAPIRELFERTTSLISHLLDSNQTILVHCHAGVSRSATIVLAFLMMNKGLSLYDAWNMVFIRRPIVRPNEGFAEELRQLEESLATEDFSTRKEVPTYWMSSNYAFWMDYLEWRARCALL